MDYLSLWEGKAGPGIPCPEIAVKPTLNPSPENLSRKHKNHQEMAHRLMRPLRWTIVSVLRQPKLTSTVNSTITRNYVSEMRKEAFEANVLRLIRNEIQYELDRAPPAQV